MTQITEADQLLFRQHLDGVRPLSPLNQARHTQQMTNARRQLHRQLRRKQTSIEEDWLMLDEPACVQQQVQAQTTLYFQRPEANRKQVNALLQGRFATRCLVDLHGLTEAQADEKMQQLLQTCRLKTDRYALIVHGKGLGSGGEQPILKNWLNWWLRNQSRVMAFCSAQPQDGGTGAVYVLFAR